MRIINNIKIFSNKTPKSARVENKLKKLLLKNNFNIVDKNPDLVIAVGGDGAFLRMVKQENYNSELIYIGINSGTLGFLQEIKMKDIDEFINTLNNNKFFIEEIGIQETDILADEKEFTFFSLNEIVIREKELNTAYLKLYIDGNYLEEYAGDGILISTSIGSTAYNLSFGGSIIYNSLHTLQITPVAPLNSIAHRTLLNSVVIPEKSFIKVIPNKERNSILISVDGENKEFSNVTHIKTKLSDKKLKAMHYKDYNYWERVNEKFLSK